MAGKERQNYLQGAAVMTVGILIVKILGACFKIPLGSMSLLGDEGYSHFSSAYNIYSVFLTLATAGFPIALSRMISEADTLGKHTQVERTFRVSLVFLAALGLASCLIMMCLPEALARYLGDEEAAEGIFVLGPAVLLVCLISVYRGYCQGHGNMTPTAVSQVLEVLLKVPVGLLLAWWLVRRSRGLALASAGAIFGVFIGSAGALAYLIWRKRKLYGSGRQGGESLGSGELFADLLRIGIPITLGGCVLSLINITDNAQILNLLQSRAGYTAQEAQVLFGIYGKVLTLYMLPTYFMTPFQASVVPAVSSYLAEGREEEACGTAESALRTATVVTLPMCLGLSVLSYAIVNVLWPGSHADGPGLLSVLGIASFFVCLTMLTNALLQATGHERLTLVGMAAGWGAKLLANRVLLASPAVNIYGAAVSAILCFAVMAGLNYLFLCRYLPRRPRLSRFLLRPLLSSLAMAAAAFGAYRLLAALLQPAGFTRMGTAAAMAAAIVLAVLVYLGMIIFTKAVTAEDVSLMPKGDKIAKLLHLS